MMSYEYGSHRVGSKRAGHIAGGHARGGKVHSDEAADRKLFGKMMAEREAKEGSDSAPPGPKSRERFDRPVRGYKRGGSVKGPKEVTINLNLDKGQQTAALPPVPPPPPGPPVVLPPPPTPAGGPAAGPPIPPPGAGGPPPMMAKRGGRIPHTGEAKEATSKAYDIAHNKKGYSSGGRIHTYPKMPAGGDSGVGRLAKMHAYGAKAKGRD